MPRRRVLLRRKYPQYPSGFRFKIYGHTFTIDRDGTASAMIDADIAKHELKAGRYVLPEKSETSQPKIDTQLLDNFGYDIGTYYGAGGLEKLKSRISAMRKAEITLFVETRLDQKFPKTMGKERMVFATLDLVRDRYNEIKRKEREELEKQKAADAKSKEESKKTPLEELDEIERKIKINEKNKLEKESDE